MARGKKDDTFELLWKGLVVIPAVVGFLLAFHLSGSASVAVAVGVGGAGIGIGVLWAIRISEEEKLKRSGIYEIDKMSGRQFEHYLGHLFRTQGYQVQVTSASGDYGADLVLKKDGATVAVQAKRHGKNVGIKAVQEAQAAIAYYKVQEAWVVSNQAYTEAAKSLAKANKVRLIGRSDLVRMITKMNFNPSQTPTQIVSSIQEDKLTCDRCGREMVLKKGDHGEFWRCSDFPKCLNIKRRAQ